MRLNKIRIIKYQSLLLGIRVNHSDMLVALEKQRRIRMSRMTSMMTASLHLVTSQMMLFKIRSQDGVIPQSRNLNSLHWTNNFKSSIFCLIVLRITLFSQTRNHRIPWTILICNNRTYWTHLTQALAYRIMLFRTRTNLMDWAQVVSLKEFSTTTLMVEVVILWITINLLITWGRLIPNRTSSMESTIWI